MSILEPAQRELAAAMQAWHKFHKKKSQNKPKLKNEFEETSFRLNSLFKRSSEIQYLRAALTGLRRKLEAKAITSEQRNNKVE